METTESQASVIHIHQIDFENNFVKRIRINTN